MRDHWYVYYCTITDLYIVTNNSNETECVGGPYSLETAGEIASQLNLAG